MVRREREVGQTNTSGSFCVSITAAIGIPKLLAGPQKSARSCQIAVLAIQTAGFNVRVEQR